MLALAAVSVVTAFAFGYLFLAAIRRDERLAAADGPAARPAISLEDADTFMDLGADDVTEEVEGAGGPMVKGAWFKDEPSTASVPVLAAPVRGPSVVDPPQLRLVREERR